MRTVKPEQYYKDKEKGSSPEQFGAGNWQDFIIYIVQCIRKLRSIAIYCRAAGWKAIPSNSRKYKRKKKL